MPQSRLALGLDVFLIIIHIERRLRRVLNPPDHDGGDFNWIAALVIHLELLAVQGPGAKRNSVSGLRPALPRTARQFALRQVDLRFGNPPRCPERLPSVRIKW